MAGYFNQFTLVSPSRELEAIKQENMRLTFALKGWNLAVQAYPQPDEPLQTESTGKGGSKKGS